MVKNVTVLGAGTAGMLTALWAQRNIVGSDITVVEDSSKGIIGVGESTFPSLLTFLNSIEIDPLHFIQKVEGTIKNGIKFENWNGDGESYMHEFQSRGKLNLDSASILPYFSRDCGWEWWQRRIIDDGEIRWGDLNYGSLMSKENKVDLENLTYAFQFNTNNASKYFKTVALERGIKFVDGTFESVVKDDIDNIKELVLNTCSIDTDFIFDCSGFSRLIIGGVYDQKWIPFEQQKSMKCAIPFFLESEDDIEPYTSAIAMKNGWMWKTPLQNRIGSGYVFDSDYITPDEAKEEVEEYFGHEITVNKVIPFNAGRYENVWVKNCISVGLSSGFIEPLESTSIVSATVLLERLCTHIPLMSTRNKVGVDEFNKLAGGGMDKVSDFVYIHYLTKRDDTPFWREFREKHPPSKRVSKILGLLEGNDLNGMNLGTDHLWPVSSYLSIAEGIGLVGKNHNNVYENLSPSIKEISKDNEYFLNYYAKPHKQVLKEIEEYYKDK